MRRRGRIQEAYEDWPIACPKCHALPGDPCRTPRDAVTAVHAARRQERDRLAGPQDT